MTAISGISNLPEPVFATNRFLGNIGAPLDVSRHPSDSIFDARAGEMDSSRDDHTDDNREEHEMREREAGSVADASA